MNCARNYENMLNFVKVMPKILLVSFFRTRCTCTVSQSSKPMTFSFVVIHQILTDFQNSFTGELKQEICNNVITT